MKAGGLGWLNGAHESIKDGGGGRSAPKEK